MQASKGVLLVRRPHVFAAYDDVTYVYDDVTYVYDDVTYVYALGTKATRICCVVQGSGFGVWGFGLGWRVEGD